MGGAFCVSKANTMGESAGKSIVTTMAFKHLQPKHRITEQQRLQQVQFVKDAKRRANRHSLTGKEVKDLNTFVKDKINKTIKERNRNMHAMSNFKDLLISSSDESIQSIISNNSNEESDSNSHKPAHKK
eukprot:3723546-Ditylum_brightwellii.AAC.1